MTRRRTYFGQTERPAAWTGSRSPRRVISLCGRIDRARNGACESDALSAQRGVGRACAATAFESAAGTVKSGAWETERCEGGRGLGFVTPSLPSLYVRRRLPNRRQIAKPPPAPSDGGATKDSTAVISATLRQRTKRRDGSPPAPRFPAGFWARPPCNRVPRVRLVPHTTVLAPQTRPRSCARTADGSALNGILRNRGRESAGEDGTVWNYPQRSGPTHRRDPTSIVLRLPHDFLTDWRVFAPGHQAS